LVAILFIVPSFLLTGYDDTVIIYLYLGLMSGTLIPLYTFISRKQYNLAFLVFLSALLSFVYLVVCIMSQPSSPI
jgi:hypothetical protein